MILRKNLDFIIRRIIYIRFFLWNFVYFIFLLSFVIEGINLPIINPIVFLSCFFLIIFSFLIYFFIRNNLYFKYYYIALFFLDTFLIICLYLNASEYHFIFLLLLAASLFLFNVSFNYKINLIYTISVAIIFSIITLLRYSELSKIFIVLNVLLLLIITLIINEIKKIFEYIYGVLRIKDYDLSLYEFFNKFLIENINSGCIIVDSNFNILFSNKTAQNLLDYFHEGERFFLEKIKEKMKKEKDYLFELNCNIQEKEKYFLVKINTINKDKFFNNYIIMFDEITEQKKEVKLNDVKSRLELIGRFITTIAHEIKNPLSSISASVELLKNNIKDETDKKLYNIILNEVGTLDVLFNDLLEFARPITLSKDRYNIIDILKEEISKFKIVYPNVTVKLNYTKTPININIDKNKIILVINNLLKNAYEALHNINDKKINIHINENDHDIEISFEDNGCGINDENKEKIFELFFTTKAKGTGLGLAICQKIVSLHGGSINLINKPKTKFIIILPKERA